MATAEDVIRTAESMLSYRALDDPEPGSFPGRYWAQKLNEDWLAGPSWEIHWCHLFVGWACDIATGGNASQLVDGFGTDWQICNCDRSLRKGARHQEIDKWSCRRGDIVYFDWNGNWDGDSGLDHVGIALGSFDGSTLHTVEGNVSNSVQTKYRDASTIKVVIRPKYDGEPGPAPKPSPDEPLEVDGYCGPLTIQKLQAQMGGGLIIDGVLDGQWRPNREYFWAITDAALRWDRGTGSPTVRELQRRVGCDPDGVLGAITIEHLQRKLCEMGYQIGVDGYLGNESASALQRSLNDGKWS